MDILNGAEAKRVNKLKTEMVEAISSLPIDHADVQKAEEFFDFTNDMDLSILEKVKDSTIRIIKIFYQRATS